MHRHLLLLTITLVIIGVAVSAAKDAEEKKVEGKHNVTCKGEVLNFTPLEIGDKECHDKIFGTTTVNPNNHEEMEKKWAEDGMCFAVCKWKKQKIINADGTYNKDEAGKFVKAIFPAGVQDEMKKAMDECATTNSKSFSLDKKCEGYKAFNDCKITKFREICEIKD